MSKKCKYTALSRARNINQIIIKQDDKSYKLVLPENNKWIWNFMLWLL